MAKEPASIPKEPKVPDSQNYALLKAAGVEDEPRLLSSLQAMLGGKGLRLALTA